jgi:predicted CXXCH cytochrome family protein
MVLLSRQFRAEEPIAHPFIEQIDIKSETCLTCHPEKKQGKFVHSAVGMGCENCHQAKSEINKTTITFVATGGDLCAKCHEASKDPVQHAPFKTGQCLVCHDPHTGDYKAQTRAPVNTLCLSCHGENPSIAKVNKESKLVTMLGNQLVSLEGYAQAPKLGLDPGGTSGHPVRGHPLTGKDPRRKDGILSCLSCHSPHSSALPKLMPAGLKSNADLCAQCHKIVAYAHNWIWVAEGRGAAEDLSLGYHCDFMPVNGGQRNDPVLQGPLLGGRS